MKRSKHFRTQVDALLSEIDLSLYWNGPIILFAIYRSSHVFEDAEALLKEALEKKKQVLVPARIESSLPNLVEIIKPFDYQRSVFSVVDLDKGGGGNEANAYRFLNLYREYFIEKKIRLVFWVTEVETQRLALLAPDFWAFRHGVFDFTKNRATPKRSAAFSGLSWQEFPWQPSHDDVDAALAYRSELLRDMPTTPETLLMRLDLRGELAGLYFQNGDLKRAEQIVVDGLAQLPERVAPAIEVKFLLSLAITQLYENLYAQAQVSIQKALDIFPEDAYLLMLLSQVHRFGGRRSEALSAIKKALSSEPESAVALNEAGNIYVDLGRLEKALAAYQKAFELSSRPEPLLNKVATLFSMQRRVEAFTCLQDFSCDGYPRWRDLVDEPGFEFLEQIC